ncbi:MAG: phage major capsid protein [Pseudomonadota bacterium]
MNDSFETFMHSFENYKEANDRRLHEIECKGGADIITTEKLNRLSDELDRQKQRYDALTLKAQRPRMDGAPKIVSEQKAAFDSYMRRGDVGNLESKSLSVGTNADGGYTVPVEIEAMIGQRLANISPIRAIASVRQVSSNMYRKPFATNGFATGWAAETGARSQTNNSTLDALVFPTNELYAMPAATPALLDDSAVNIDEWIASEVELAFAQQEGTAFVSGDGTNKPKGFLSYTTVANASWEWNKLGFITTGDADSFADTDPSDRLVDLIYSLEAGYRQNAHFVLNRRTQAAIRKFKSEDGSYLWTPPAAPGASAMLMGFPVVEAEDMPDIAANAFPLAFGDFRSGYLIVDRAGIQVLRDPYSAKPYVLFYTVKRVGGGVQDFAAIKLLKVAA